MDYSASNKIEEDSKEYDNTPDTSQIRRSINKKTNGKEGYYTKLIKKEIKVDDPLEQWRKLNLKDIIPESKLRNNINSSEEDEIMFQGELFKLIATKAMNSTAFNKYFSSRYLVFTKTELRCYKNKESFLMLQNPSQKIPSFHISQVSRINANIPLKGKKLYYLVIHLLSSDMTKSNINDFSNSITNKSINILKSNKSLFNPIKQNFEDYADILEQSLNEDGSRIDSNSLVVRKREKLRDNKGRIKSVKMLPIETSLDATDQEEKNKSSIMYKQYMQSMQSQIDDSINIYSSNVLVFSSEKEDLINKWVLILDYFSSKI